MNPEITTDNSLRVLMFPYLAVGHITPFLELAKKLSHRGFSIHLCSTPINLSFIKNKHSSSIQLVELYLPELPDLPPHYHTTNGLPLHLKSTLQIALQMAKPTFSNLMETLKPHLLIYDALMPWAAGVAKSHHIPAFRFFTSTAAACSYFCHLFFRPTAVYPFPELHLGRYEHERTAKLIEEKKSQRKDDETDNNMMVVSTSREIEGKYLDYLGELLGCKVLPVGTLVRERVEQDGCSKLIEWLRLKEEKSTVFASFGSEYYLSKEEIEEVAYGLEQSHVNFIWVVRFPKGGEKPNLDEALPKGFLEKVGDRGRVVVEWAPQTVILSHPSIGGFLSHGGWNSLVESLEYGVPIIAVPMHLDQPMNAKVIVEIGVGIEILKDDSGKLHREDVSRALRDVIGGKVGKNLRRKVKIVGENVRLKSLEEMDETTVILTKISSHQECNIGDNVRIMS